MGKGFIVDRYNFKVFMKIYQYINLNFFYIFFFDFMDKFNNKVFENRYLKKMMKLQNVSFDL